MSPLLRLKSLPRPCARHVEQDVSHSCVWGAFGQRLTIVRILNIAGLSKVSVIGRLSDTAVRKDPENDQRDPAS
jgi:hypothetical protein